MEGLRKTTEDLSQYSRSPGRHLNPVHTKYEAAVFNNSASTFGPFPLNAEVSRRVPKLSVKTSNVYDVAILKTRTNKSDTIRRYVYDTGQFKKNGTLSYVYQEIISETTITWYASIARETLKVLDLKVINTPCHTAHMKSIIKFLPHFLQKSSSMAVTVPPGEQAARGEAQDANVYTELRPLPIFNPLIKA
jgi:hypothetical protein